MTFNAKDPMPELDVATLPEPVSESIHSVPRLIAATQQNGKPEILRRAIEGVRSAHTSTLVIRIATTGDPLLLWAIHLALDGRGVAPALRWPENDASPQAAYLTWLADMFWLTKRNRGHVPSYRSWQGLFKHPPATSAWHATAYRNYLYVASRYSLAHWCSKGLNLTAPQRAELLTLPTNAMQADRRQLSPERVVALRERLLSHAIEHPDRAGKFGSETIANRRARLWRVFILSGRNHTATAHNWKLLTGQSLTRQAVSKQLGIVAEVSRQRGAT